MKITVAKRAGPISLVLIGLLCATAQGQPSPLVAGNNAAAGNGPIATTDFPEGPTVSFIPDGAKAGTDSNGRGILVLGNKVYYTELSNLFGPTDFIRVAPFNGGKGGSDNAVPTVTTGAFPDWPKRMEACLMRPQPSGTRA
jgi:hypothetical protein